MQDSRSIIRLVVADDHDIVRRGICATLQNAPEIEIAGEAINGREAVRMAAELQPAIVIMDINMPELNGLDATRLIARELPQVQVLILSMHESEQLLREVLEAGARGYVLKSDAGQELVRAVRALNSGQVYFTPKVSEMLMTGYLGRCRPAGERVKALSGREREVVQLLAEGRSNKEVATSLGISVKTVETHRARIMDKLNLKAFSSLVRYAVRNNIVNQ